MKETSEFASEIARVGVEETGATVFEDCGAQDVDVDRGCLIEFLLRGDLASEPFVLLFEREDADKRPQLWKRTVPVHDEIKRSSEQCWIGQDQLSDDVLVLEGQLDEASVQVPRLVAHLQVGAD